MDSKIKMSANSSPKSKPKSTKKKSTKKKSTKKKSSKKAHSRLKNIGKGKK